jgi:RNA polymerase sigma-70 factor (ECF subfamily)
MRGRLTCRMSPIAALQSAFINRMEPSRSSSDAVPLTFDAASSGPTADEQDVLWMLRVRGGDRQAFSELVECHQLRVVGTVARMLGADAADAEDIGQQVFLRVWKSAARYEPTAKFTTWLYTITRNLVFNELRRRKHRPVTSLDAVTAPDGAEGAVQQFRDLRAVSPDSALLESELQDAIAEAIASLPETQRMAIVLRRYEELSYEEIGSVLDLTAPAVKSLLFRARLLLREKLSRYMEG